MVPRALLLALALPSLALALTPLSDDVLAKVLTNAQLGTYSWENGTLARALTDFYHPALSPYRLGFVNALTTASEELDEGSVLGGLARATLVSKVASFGNGSLDGYEGNSSAARANSDRFYLSLLDDGAAGDPASLGEVVMWASRSGWTDFDYAVAAEDEITFLTEVVPRTSAGAISHRRDQAQLWSDSTFMVPPFLAYYAAVTNNQTLMVEAVEQCSLYRDVLKGESGLWKHIMLGEGSIDDGEWATGNGWAAGGMLRVLATIVNSDFNEAFSSQRSDLQSWIEEILAGAAAHQFETGLMHNYVLNRTNFIDAAGPIMLAGVAYRLSAMNLTSVYVPYAERTYGNLTAYLGSDDGADGWVTPVVNPYDWLAPGKESPEAQSFVLIMEAARRDWVAEGSRNETGTPGSAEDENPTSAGGLLSPSRAIASVAFALASIGLFAGL